MNAPSKVWRQLASLSLLSAVGSACSQELSQDIVGFFQQRFSKPDSGIATRALPAPGTTVPYFEYPTLRAFTSVSKPSLRGQPTVLALWSFLVPTQPSAMQQLDSLARQYNDSRIRFVVIADHGNDAVLDSVLRSASWRYRVDAVGLGWRQLQSFDRSHANPRVNGRYGEFRLPSFLLISQDGQIIRRTADPPYDVLKPALDSLRRVFAATTPAEDVATVAAIRPRLEQSLIAFNPEQLANYGSGDAVRLDGTCATQETSPVGIIPATGRVLDVHATEGVVRAIVELVHVAVVVPAEFGDVCAADRVTIRHRVGVDTLAMSLQRIGVGDTSVAWSAMGALRRPEGHPNPTNVALFGTSLRKQYVTFWPGVSESYLRDRIDSIRRVRASTNR